MTLHQLGWQESFDPYFKPFQNEDFHVVRVAIENRDNYLVPTETQEYFAEVTGKLLFNAKYSSDLPRVGDWIVVSLLESKNEAIIHKMLPWKTKFLRKLLEQKPRNKFLPLILIIFLRKAYFQSKAIDRYSKRWIIDRHTRTAQVSPLESINTIG